MICAAIKALTPELSRPAATILPTPGKWSGRNYHEAEMRARLERIVMPEQQETEMGQITIAFAEQMLVHAERGEHAPLTVHEEEQLARRWLESEHLCERCADSLRFYGALNVGDLFDKQAQHIERLQEKLHRLAPAEPARSPQVRA